MLGADDAGDPVKDIVVGQDRAQQLLFGLDRMGHGVHVRAFNSGRVECGDLVHAALAIGRLARDGPDTTPARRGQNV